MLLYLRPDGAISRALDYPAFSASPPPLRTVNREYTVLLVRLLFKEGGVYSMHHRSISDITY